MAESAPSLRIFLYDDPDTAGLDIDLLGAFLADTVPAVSIQVRTDFFTSQLARFPEEQRDVLVEQLSQKLDEARVENLVHPAERHRLPPESPDVEEENLIYEGAGLSAILRMLVPPDEASERCLHIVLLSHDLGQWLEGEPLLHRRVAILGEPSLISTNDIVQSPALPRRYRFMRAQVAWFGADDDLEELAEQFEGETIGYGDPRLNEVLKGYLLQAVVYRTSGETGCDDTGCRLHIAYSHDEIVATQTAGGRGLCAYHHDFLQTLE